MAVIAMACVVILAFVLLSLPAFSVSRVKVVGDRVPPSVERELETLVGKQIFSIRLYRLKRRLSEMPVVESASVRRRLPSTVEVGLSVTDPQAVVCAMDDEGNPGNLYLVRSGRLLEVDPEDRDLYGQDTVRVEIPEGYALMLEKYGVDEVFSRVMGLASSLGEDATLITRIKYDNNSSNSFGKMVFEFSSLDAQLWVREPVGTGRIASAVSLIRAEREDSLSFLSDGPIRYDLYRRALVRRS
jgi:hypothetical protein